MSHSWTAFVGKKRLVTGDLATTLRALVAHAARGKGEALVFDDETGRQVDFDLRGTEDEVIARALGGEQKGPGRPKLGVLSREVSMLPRHWAWLERDPRGASAALRRLVEEEMKRDPAGERAARALDAASKFTWAMCGSLPGFEEASRALYRRDEASWKRLTRKWPVDLRAHADKLAAPVWA